MSGGNWGEITLRLAIAILAGGAIGWNRQYHHKAAGLRTHMLVALGAALFVTIPIAIAAPSDVSNAASRAIQGVATGVGFLGAGEILHYRLKSGAPSVQGLTSAASIWVTSALGMMAAAGLWELSLIGTGFTLLILIVAKWAEKRVAEQADEE